MLQGDPEGTGLFSKPSIAEKIRYPGVSAVSILQPFPFLLNVLLRRFISAAIQRLDLPYLFAGRRGASEGITRVLFQDGDFFFLYTLRTMLISYLDFVQG